MISRGKQSDPCDPEWPPGGGEGGRSQSCSILGKGIPGKGNSKCIDPQAEPGDGTREDPAGRA